MSAEKYNAAKIKTKKERDRLLTTYKSKIAGWIEPLFPLTVEAVEQNVPAEPGVYVLFRDHVLTRFGESQAGGKETSDIRERLDDHAHLRQNLIDNPKLELKPQERTIATSTYFCFKQLDSQVNTHEYEENLITQFERVFGYRPEGNPELR